MGARVGRLVGAEVGGGVDLSFVHVGQNSDLNV